MCSDRFTDNLTRGQVAFSKCQLILQLSKIAEKIPPGKPTTKPLDYVAIRLNFKPSDFDAYQQQSHVLREHSWFGRTKTFQNVGGHGKWKFQNVDILILNSSKVLIHRPSFFPALQALCLSQSDPMTDGIPMEVSRWKRGRTWTMPASQKATDPEERPSASQPCLGGSCETPTPQIMTNLSPHLGILYEYLDKIMGLPMKMMEDEVENHRHHHRKNHRPGFFRGSPRCERTAARADAKTRCQGGMAIHSQLWIKIRLFRLA